MSNSSKGVLIKGGAWTSLSFIFVSLVYILRISVLTRYIDKSDFGLVAIVLFVLGFTNIFADLGVSSALLSKKDVSQKEYSSLYWGGLFLSLFLYILIFLSSPLFAEFYGYNILKSLIPVMGIDIVISTLGRQFSVFKQKEFKFKELALIKIISEVISLLIDIILAINGFGIWTLVFSVLSSSIVTLLLNFITSYKSHPVLFYFNIKETKSLYIIGFYQTGSQILDYFSSQIDVLILGKLLPMSEMGVYSIIKTLIFRVYSSLNQIVTKVLIPIFSVLKNDLINFKIKYLKYTNFISIINVFIYSLLAIVSKSVLYLFYGKYYVTEHSLLEILCIWGLFSSIVSCSGATLIIATGRTEVGFKWTQIRFLLNPFFVFVGAYFGGSIGVCIAQALFSFLSLFVYYKIVVLKIINILDFNEFFKNTLGPTIVGLFFYPIFLFLNRIINVDNNFLLIFINGAFLFIIYILIFGKVLLKHIKEI